MRRLPVYFLIDVSESMVGEPIRQVEDGMATIIRELKTDPYALETVWVSIIAFAGQARTLVPLQDVISFYPPRFPIGSGTSLGRALQHLMAEMKRDIKPTTYEQKGDWKPIIFLFTDGVPTDDASAAIQQWQKECATKCNLVVISFGTDTDAQLLRQLTDNILMFHNTDASAYKHFFKWVSASVRTNSERVDNSTNGFELAKPDGDTLSRIDLTKPAPPARYNDPNFVVVTAKCQNTRQPYLIKYRKVISDAGIAGLDISTRTYKLVGAYPVAESYFEMADNGHVSKVHSDELIGSPTCPCCGNQIVFAQCSCYNLLCIGVSAENTCPWCGTTGRYGAAEGGFDVNKSLG